MFLRLIYACWDVFALAWVVSMFTTKRTVKRETSLRRFRYWFLFLAAFWLLFRAAFAHRALVPDLRVIPPSTLVDVLALTITLLGLAFAIWARIVLGRNWSGTVTFKEDHELIERGPYALVRHPIYTGMLLMFFGTALAVGTLGALAGFPLLLLSFWIKYRSEEALMVENFGKQYRDYKERVPALIPRFYQI